MESSTNAGDIRIDVEYVDCLGITQRRSLFAPGSSSSAGRNGLYCFYEQQIVEQLFCLLCDSEVSMKVFLLHVAVLAEENDIDTREVIEDALRRRKKMVQEAENQTTGSE